MTSATVPPAVVSIAPAFDSATIGEVPVAPVPSVSQPTPHNQQVDPVTPRDQPVDISSDEEKQLQRIHDELNAPKKKGRLSR